MSDGSHEAATLADNRSFWQKVGDGFAGAGASILSIGKSFSDEVGDIVSDAKKIGSGVVDGIKSIGNGIASLVESTWESLVATDDDARRRNDITLSRLMWETGEMQCIIDVNTVYKYNKNTGNGDPKSHRDYVDYFDAKMRLSKDPTTNKEYKINESDKANLLKTLSQKNNGQLSQEIFDTVKSNIELFEKKSGLEFKDDDAIKAFANRAANNACMNANLYAQLKFVGSDVEQYYGNFYLKNVERDYLVKDHTGLVMDQAVSYQRIVNNYDVDGNKIDVQYMGYDKTADIFKNEYNQNAYSGKFTKNEVYKSLLQSNQSDIVVRFSNRRGNGHNTSISNDHLYDTGLANRRWRANYKKYIDEDNIRSFYFLRARSR